MFATCSPFFSDVGMAEGPGKRIVDAVRPVARRRCMSVCSLRHLHFSSAYSIVISKYSSYFCARNTFPIYGREIYRGKRRTGE